MSDPYRCTPLMHLPSCISAKDPHLLNRLAEWWLNNTVSNGNSSDAVQPSHLKQCWRLLGSWRAFPFVFIATFWNKFGCSSCKFKTGFFTRIVFFVKDRTLIGFVVEAGVVSLFLKAVCLALLPCRVLFRCLRFLLADWPTAVAPSRHIISANFIPLCLLFYSREWTAAVKIK